MRDLIDREQALKALRGAEAITRVFGYHNVYEAIRRVPSAKPPPETCWGCNCPKMEEPKIAEPKWIPVSERLPENMNRVLIAKRIIDEETVVDIGWYFAGEKTRYTNEFEVADVVAWMKLPERYENEVKK